MYIRKSNKIEDRIKNIESIIKDLNQEGFNFKLLNYDLNTDKVLIIDDNTKEIVLDEYYNKIIFYINFLNNTFKDTLKKYFA